MSIIIMILVAILVFGLVIFFHELGHFFVAKKAKIKVNEFALGMGPTLFKFQKGETTYAIRAFPIGGFVSMEGEDEESSDDRSFTKAPVYKRMLVIIAGAFMNLVLGFLCVVLLVATDDSMLSRTVSQVGSEESPFKVGDKIIKVNGRRCFTINDISYEFARTQNGTFSFVVVRDGEKVKLENVAFEVRLAYDKDTGEEIIDESTGEQYKHLYVGFAVAVLDKNFFTVVNESFLTTMSYGRVIYLSVADLIMGKVPVNQLSGPVGIVSEIGRAIKLGWRQVVNMLALISINLGVMNMLPFPALDGGKAVLLLVEGIRRKPMNQKYEIAINLVGFAALMLLMLFVSFNDIRKLIGL